LKIHKAFFVQARTALRPSTFDNTYELLRSFAALAILQTFEFR
jgi:hypothetical protein